MSSGSRRRIAIAGLALTLCLAALWFVHVFYRAQESSRCVSCVGRLSQLRYCLRRALDDGQFPLSDSATRRDDGLDAIQALAAHDDSVRRFQCPTFTLRFSDAVARGSYRMPDWTPEQWNRAAGVALYGREAGFYEAPDRDVAVLWDTLPVHGGRRNVLFMSGHVRRCVPEDEFHALRRADEEFVRAVSATTNPRDP